MGVAIDFEDESGLFDWLQANAYAAVLCDACDQAGYRHQMMRANINPIHPDMVVVGRAMPIQTRDVCEAGPEPYTLEIESVDSLRPNQVAVCSTYASTQTCIWGELLSTASRCRGARGCIIDGYVRDVKKIVEMGFPVLATGTYPVDSLGRSEVIAYNCPVECGGVVVQPGDIVFGDVDGVVVIPQAAERDVIMRAAEKIDGENMTRTELLEGKRLKDVYDKYGVL